MTTPNRVLPKSSGSNVVSATFSTPPAAGAKVIVALVGYQDLGDYVASVTDNQGNGAYTLDGIKRTGNGKFAAAIYSCDNVGIASPGSGFTITATPDQGGSTFTTILGGVAIVGMGAHPTVNVVGSALAANPHVANFTTSVVTTFAVAAIQDSKATSGGAWTLPGGSAWTEIAQESGAAGLQGFSGYRDCATAAAYSTNVSYADPDGDVYPAIVVAYAPAVSGPLPTVTCGSPSGTLSTLSVAGTVSSTPGSPVVTVTLTEAGGSTITAQANVNGSNWTLAAPVSAGVWSVAARAADANGTGLSVAGSGTWTVVGIDGSANLPSAYYVQALVAVTPNTSVRIGQQQQLQVTDQGGTGVQVALTSSNPSAGTVPAQSDAQGRFTLNGVAAGTTTITAQAVVNGVTLSTTIAVTVTAASAPTAPSNLVGVAGGATAVNLSWSDNSSDETGFVVQWSATQGGTYTTLATTGPNATSYVDTTIAAATTRWYKVAATNSAGTSSYTAAISVTTPAAVDTTPPTIAAAVSTTSVTTTTPLTITAAASDSGSGMASVQFYRNGAAIGAAIAAPGPYTTTLALTEADNGTIQITARATDAAGNSQLSAPVAVTVAIPPAVQVPGAPSAPQAVEMTPTSVRSTWLLASTTATAVELDVRTDTSGWTLAASLPGNATSGTAAGLMAATHYTFRVRARNTAGYSDYSPEWAATTAAAPPHGLASVTPFTPSVSAPGGATSVVRLLAVNATGDPAVNVSVRATISDTAVGTVSPATALTDASGIATFTVTHGARVAEATIAFSATDGIVSLGTSQITAVQVVSLPSYTLGMVQALAQSQIDPKYSTEVLAYVVDFSSRLATGETLVAPPVLVEVIQLGVETPQPEMLFGNAIVVGNYVVQFLRGGGLGLSYVLAVHCQTSTGQIVKEEIELRVWASAGHRATQVG